MAQLKATSKAKNESVPIMKARESLGELANRAGYGHERIVLTRRGRPLAALISVADLAKLEGAA